MNELFMKIGSVIASGLIALASFFGAPASEPEQNLGAYNTVAGKSYYLYAGGIGTSDTSVTLTSFKTPVSNYNFAMADFGSIGYVTIEPGNSTRQEFASFTGITQNSDGTATLTGVTRGLSPITPYTASTTLQKSHPGGSVVVVSNPPQLYEKFATLENNEWITGTWGFSVNATSTSDCTLTTEYCRKAYVDGVAVAGASNAAEDTKGIVEISTKAEAADGRSFGATGAMLALPARMASSTRTTATTTIPVTNTSGFISETFIATTSDYNWTGQHLFQNASTTIVGGLTVGGNSTSTHATSTNLAVTGTATTSSLFVSNTASTTNLTVSGSCTGCPTTYTASSTAFSVSSGTVTYTGSIPTTANIAFGQFVLVSGAGADMRGNFFLSRSGMTVSRVGQEDDTASGGESEFSFTWSGANFSVEEVTDDSSSISGTIYWYK